MSIQNKYLHFIPLHIYLTTKIVEIVTE